MRMMLMMTLMLMTPTTMHDGQIMITYSRLVEYQMSQKSQRKQTNQPPSHFHYHFQFPYTNFDTSINQRFS